MTGVKEDQGVREMKIENNTVTEETEDITTTGRERLKMFTNTRFYCTCAHFYNSPQHHVIDEGGGAQVWVFVSG